MSFPILNGHVIAPKEKGQSMRDRKFAVNVGSGFSGSLLAWILQRQGKEVVLIDRGTHPRFAIG